jgi:hypothetical protein
MTSWMNEYEIDEAAQRYANHPVLGPATRTLANLRDMTNSNSDGWPYWRKPASAAMRLCELVTRDGTAKYLFDDVREDATVAEYRKALAPVKSFRTRMLRTGPQFAFEIVDAS